MKLVCFLGLTGGGLVCDLLNHKKSIIKPDGTVDSREHNIFKGATAYLDKGPFNEDFWNTQKKRLFTNNHDVYFGTHTHPSNIPNKFLNEFTEVIVITSTSKKCKWYKYLRYKNLYQHMQLHPETILIDYPCINNYTEISFSDIVDGEFVKRYNLSIENFENWKKHNTYLYTEPLTEDLTEFNLLFDNYKNLYGTTHSSTN